MEDFIDARRVPNEAEIETDVCVVGAGAAGVTLARELAGQRIRVCLLESGGLTADDKTQSLCQVENVGHPYPRLNGERLRLFGGTTNHWGGACRPLDEIDFAQRDWVNESGWPFDLAHLQPYYRRAQAFCQLGPFDYDVRSWDDGVQPLRLPLAENRVATTVFQFSPPTRFGVLYRDEVESARNIRTYLHANVLELEANEDSRRVRSALVASLAGNRFRITARAFVLATGGIENARLLLLSNRVQRTGLGNAYGLVGRYFGGHPEVVAGVSTVRDTREFSPLYYEPFVTKGFPIMGVLTLPANELRRERLLNFMIEVKQLEEPLPSDTDRSVRETVARSRLPAGFWAHVSRMTSRRPSSDTVGTPRAIRVFKFQLEMEPNAESRITLSDTRDLLGQPKARVTLRYGDAEQRTVTRALELLGRELGRAGLGRLWADPEAAGQLSPAPGHHMGTTRMHTDPRKGVVDVDGRVHGIANLFVAGVSLNPTTGYANPTLTVVALAIRLADHLKRVMA